MPNTSCLLTFHVFADDTNIYFSSKNLSHLEATLNHELKYVAKWMKYNRLALSISKTNFIACEQALPRGAGGWREEEKEPAIMSHKFAFLRPKSGREMLIG